MKNVLKSLAVFLLLCSIALALYPSISKTQAQNKCNKAVERFDEITNTVVEGSFKESLKNGVVDKNGLPTDNSSDYPVLYKEDLERLFKDSVAYNDELQETQQILHSSDFEYSALNLYDYGIQNGMYGYISAKSINLLLPIYLGATQNNMAYGAGHLYMTSLPIGGIGTNTVLAGHTGYTGKTFFDRIGNLSVGDEVVIKNYFETLTYSVCALKSVDSYNIEDVYINKSKDLLTLVTCTNGGTARLLVICERKD